MKLIKLQDKYILVSNETIVTGDYVYESISGIYGPYEIGDIVENPKKIIAGILELPLIDFSVLKEEDCKRIGFVDVEKLAEKEYPEKLGNVYKEEGLTFEEDLYEDYRIGFIKGFKIAQSLNDNMFSLDDMKQCFLSAREFNSIDGVVDIDVVLNFTSDNSDLQAVHVNFEDYIQSLQQTSWEVKIEMETITHIPSRYNHQPNSKDFLLEKQPKITNNSIKITKIL